MVSLSSDYLSLPRAAIALHVPALAELLLLDKAAQQQQLAPINQLLLTLTAEQRVAWALTQLPAQHVLSSSFGIQAAVCLHLLGVQQPQIPVILTDTGYLFAETYRFIDELTERLQLNLHIFRAEHSPAWQEARYGRLWEQGVEGITQYNQLNKVEPMQQALQSLGAQTWFSGLRHSQSDSRAALPILAIQRGVFKFLPIVDWSDRQIYQYLTEHQLPYHPLREQGYLSVGDTHTTQKWEPGMIEEQTRFFGLKRECGLHEEPENQGSGI